MLGVACPIASAPARRRRSARTQPVSAASSRARPHRWASAPAGSMPSDARPGSLPLATLGTRIESTLSRDISGSPGSQFHQRGLQPAHKRGQRDLGRSMSPPSARPAHQFGQRVHLRPGAFDDLADAPGRSGGTTPRPRPPPTPAGSALAPASGITGASACRRAKRLRKRSLGAKDHRGPQHRQVQAGSLQQCLFTGGLAAQVVRRRVGPHPQRADVHQRARPAAGRRRQAARQRHVHLVRTRRRCHAGWPPG
jgi:hypothetical protein